MTRTSLLRSPSALRRLCALGVLVAAGIGFSAAQARAAGETITITQDDPTAVTGHATNFTASGALNPDDTMFGFDIYIFAKDADLDPTCAADEATESAAAVASGGNEAYINPPGGFEVGMGPTFTQPFKVTFSGPGHYLLCGYVNGDFSTFAAGQLGGVVTSAQVTDPPTPTPTPTPTPPAPTPAAPVGQNSTPPAPSVVHAPWITLSHHVLTCHAGTWANNPTSRSYGWYVKGHSKQLASSPKLKVERSLRGHQVLCRVTTRNTAGSKTASSRAIRAN
jgi:hypothetical protein